MLFQISEAENLSGNMPGQVSRMGWPPLTLVHIGNGQYAPMMMNAPQWSYPSQWYGSHGLPAPHAAAPPPHGPQHPAYPPNSNSFHAPNQTPQISIIESDRLNLLSEDNFPPLIQSNKIQELPTNITNK